LHLSNELKLSIIENCKSNTYSYFGSYKIVKKEQIDGFKFHLDNGSWVMIRPSGTEPVLRVYAESTDSAAAFAILETTKTQILNG
jgi:phosphomannomutase